jgi:hypothetical protein
MVTKISQCVRAVVIVCGGVTLLRFLFAIAVAVLSICQAGCSRQFVGDADQMNAFQLMKAAATAGSAGQSEDAAYLFLVGQARFQIDKQVYPPAEKGGDSPGVLAAALSTSMGESVLKPVINNPTAFMNVSARLTKWSPKFDADYDPGWKYVNPLQAAAIAPIVAATQKKMITAIESKTKLLQIPEYRQLSTALAEATIVERKYWASVEANHSANAVPDDLKKEYAAAQSKHVTAAKRMKEIELATNPESRWYAQVGWKAEDYFNDARVVELCHAIEADNVPEMERLIAADANANAAGKDGMTPLLWAFPDRKLARFECLLKHGADPNVVFQSDFNTGARPFHPYPIGGSAFNDHGCHAGQSITLLAATSPMIEYLQLVLEHGGNPNIVDGKTDVAPLDVVLERDLFDSDKRVALLVNKGANVNRFCKYKGGFPTMQAVSNDRYDIALALLKAGADPSAYQPDGVWKLTNFLVRKE